MMIWVARHYHAAINICLIVAAAAALAPQFFGLPASAGVALAFLAGIAAVAFFLHTDVPGENDGTEASRQPDLAVAHSVEEQKGIEEDRVDYAVRNLWQLQLRKSLEARIAGSSPFDEISRYLLSGRQAYERSAYADLFEERRYQVNAPAPVTVNIGVLRIQVVGENADVQKIKTRLSGQEGADDALRQAGQPRVRTIVH